MKPSLKARTGNGWARQPLPNYALYEERKRELDAMNLPYPEHERRRRQIEQETGV